MTCPGSHSKKGRSHTGILGSLGSIHNANYSASSKQRSHSKEQSLLCHFPAPNPPVAPYCPWDEDKILPCCLQTLSTPSSFSPHFSWLSAHCCPGPLCSQNISPSCSCQKAFVPAISSTWSTLSHSPLIYPHLINFSSSKHLLQKAYPDCHPWSTPPLFPPCYIGPIASFLLLVCLCEYLTHICSSS